MTAFRHIQPGTCKSLCKVFAKAKQWHLRRIIFSVSMQHRCVVASITQYTGCKVYFVLISSPLTAHRGGGLWLGNLLALHTNRGLVPGTQLMLKGSIFNWWEY